MKTMKFEQIILRINIFSLIYFTVLIAISYYPIEITLFNVIAQIITIPLLLFLIFSLGYSFFKIIKKQKNRDVFLILILSLLSIIFLTILTIIQMR